MLGQCFPCFLYPNFLSWVSGWGPKTKRKACSDVEFVILGGSGQRNYSQHCRKKMALEGFLRVGGVWHFLPVASTRAPRPSQCLGLQEWLHVHPVVLHLVWLWLPGSFDPAGVGGTHRLPWRLPAQACGSEMSGGAQRL
ncbi:hypothetical protein HJG60_012074 [Phyllostomus discolor]|uniref:Uncharacterized protein n=1 Tax=Phyllostomus discolor TaxID=89673 RepID=A0A833ZM87_9CHIR|nr:hypothetical protein HJG60_012074 [Phyllostomus discolor]